MKESRKVEVLYPSYTKKAITFTIDDGNIPNDTKFLSIVRPAGIKGTFNLCSDRLSTYSVDFYRSFYSGYEIANHCKYHPFISYDGVEYKVADTYFDEKTADEAYVYPVKEREGFYAIKKPNGWREMVFEDDFLKYIKEGLEELKSVFGDKNVRDFVWPYGSQDNAAAHNFIKSLHRSSRKTGCTRDTDAFNIPKDKYTWSYNANHNSLLEVMEIYEAYPDDGSLKFFAFGVHSIDFERDSKWGDLEAFAEKYGNRPRDYWYASVGEIFDYEEAVKQLRVNDEGIYNPTEIPVYVSVDGERAVVSPLGVYSFR